MAGDVSGRRELVLLRRLHCGRIDSRVRAAKLAEGATGVVLDCGASVVAPCRELLDCGRDLSRCPPGDYWRATVWGNNGRHLRTDCDESELPCSTRRGGIPDGCRRTVAGDGRDPHLLFARKPKLARSTGITG